MTHEDIERFFSKFEIDDTGCWLWTARTVGGYGGFGYGSASYPAHRVAYEWMVGPIPDGMEIDHKCERRNCVNPDHLEPVQRWVNAIRSYAKATYRQPVRYDRENVAHPRIKDVWGRTRAGRHIRVEICDVVQGSELVVVRYVKSRGRRAMSLALFLDEWRMLSRWPGLERGVVARRGCVHPARV